MRTIQLVDGTTIVVRQIAAVGQVVNKEKNVEIENDEPLPPDSDSIDYELKLWTQFDIWLVGGTKMYPSVEYNINGIQAGNDRTKVVAALEQSGRANEL